MYLYFLGILCFRLAILSVWPSVVQAFEFEEGFLIKPEKCYKICKEGGCYFKDCQEPKCPGGACYFINCKNPTCSGGFCTFDECVSPTCDGGGCDFKQQYETLTSGYCKGGNCKLDGIDHPDLHYHISF